jgi:hypothetical protein
MANFEATLATVDAKRSRQPLLAQTEKKVVKEICYRCTERMHQATKLATR